ncbi:hypothetical protein [Luteolibacter luteus]|uniref:Uncharacterized protein n=1 Tax=Luteolibacter luteus TaxID=2728835 RepID=A0A858RJT7_9BACT|nr:hypothetical protein [Luteolibacter luteus]QJE97536.1 hypothetical protein HHL09_17680 [Luteolibacter luteus]
MIHFPFQDHRASGLLSRVRDDISHLRQDVANLLTHTTRHTLPRGARELADSARSQLSAGGSYAASRLRDFRSSPPKQALGVLGGAILVGVIAAGIYAVCKSDEMRAAEAEAEDEIPL